MEKHKTLLIILAIANIPIYLLFGKLFFGNWERFKRCVSYWFKSDWASMRDGTYTDDMMHEFVLWLYLCACLGAVIGEFLLIRNFIH